MVTTFGRASINRTVLECESATNGTSCRLPANTTITVPLYPSFEDEDKPNLELDEEVDAERNEELNEELNKITDDQMSDE